MSPDVSTYSREFKRLSDQSDIELVQSAMGVGKVRHNWLEMKNFTFGLLTCQVGDLAFANARTTSSTVWKEGISEDFIAMTRVSEGGGLVTLKDDAMEISAGDAYALSTDQGFKCHTPLYQDISLIAIPRLRLRQLGLLEETLRPKGEFASPGSAADVLFDLFHSFALRAQNGPALSRRALVSVNESITGMAAALLEENVPAATTELSLLAKDFIGRHLRDPELTPDTVAAALHVSKRTLYRSFADDDQTVASYIRTARLRHAKRELDHGGGVANIRDVAERWGYASSGYFAKLFQREFGCTPSEYLRKPR